MTNKTCSTCKHGCRVEGVENVIECRAMPPTPWPIYAPHPGDIIEYRSIFPEMEQSDWCSQWGEA